jgi:hypothetical protein
MSRRTPSEGPRAAWPRRAVVLAVLVAAVLAQLGPLPAALAELAGHGEMHPCGCTGAVCVCPHPAEARAACHLPGQSGGVAPAFETCPEPRHDGAPPVPGLLPVPLPAPGPALAGRLDAASPTRLLAPPGGPDPPPPRSSSEA